MSPSNQLAFLPVLLITLPSLRHMVHPPQVCAEQHAHGAWRPCSLPEPGHAQRELQQRCQLAGAWFASPRRGHPDLLLARLQQPHIARRWQDSGSGAQGLAGCRNLRTLLAASNRLAGPGALADLAQCSTLMTLDLQDNQLSDKQVQRCM